MEQELLIFRQDFSTVFTPVNATLPHPEMALAPVGPPNGWHESGPAQPVRRDGPVRPPLWIETKKKRGATAGGALKRHPFWPLSRANDSDFSRSELIRRRHVHAVEDEKVRSFDQAESSNAGGEKLAQHQPALPRNGWTSPTPWTRSDPQMRHGSFFAPGRKSSAMLNLRTRLAMAPSAPRN